MKVLFIYSLDYEPNKEKKALVNPARMHFGISYISSFLKKHGFKTDILAITENTSKNDILNFINNFNPRIIGYTSIASQYNRISKVAKVIKNNTKDIFHIIGGTHAILNPEILTTSPFDALCIGEGELPMLELCHKINKKLPISNINNLWIKNKTDIEKNDKNILIQDLDSLPFPDRNSWGKWLTQNKNFQVILLGRGCPFSCSYCCNHALRKVLNGKYVRARSVNNIMSELEFITSANPNLKKIYFEIETIGIDMNFAIELCQNLINFNFKYPNIKYGVNLRIAPNINYEELFSYFKKANFNYINIGLESGSKEIREKILNRFYTNEDVFKVVNLARKYKLRLNFYLLIGLPRETLDNFQETIRVCKICQPDEYQLNVFYPYPGTDLYNFCKENNLIKDNLINIKERKESILKNTNFNNRLIRHQIKWFYYNVYIKDKEPINKRIKYIFNNIIYKKFEKGFINLKYKFFK